MITNNETDLLFYADTLKSSYPKFCKEFIEKLNLLDIKSKALSFTKDIWCRDYMPVQVHKDKLIQFNYSPSYFRKKDLLKKTNTDDVCKELNIEPVKSEIILDGGNVVCSKDKVILTDKIYTENKKTSKEDLKNELRNLFEVDELIIIPHQPYDMFGHADGMLRFLDEKTVLINDFSSEKDYFKKSLDRVLAKHKLEKEVFTYNPSTEVNSEKVPSAKGTYINYLHIGDSILMPTFNLDSDNLAYNQLKTLYPSYRIETINCDEIANDGGILNCIGWNVKFWKLILEDYGDFYMVGDMN